LRCRSAGREKHPGDQQEDDNFKPFTHLSPPMEFSKKQVGFRRSFFRARSGSFCPG
jgi:hypothetical protein